MPVVSATESILEAVEKFSQSPMTTRRRLNAVYEEGGERFLEACLPLLRDFSDSPGRRFLVTFLLSKDLLAPLLLEPNALTLEQAVPLLRLARRVDPLFDAMLLRDQSAGASATALARILEILVASSSSSRLLPMLVQMTRHPDPHVRSKAALLYGRNSQDAKWVRRKLDSADGRTRANAVESLWGETSDAAKEIFRLAAANENRRTMGNGLYGLYLAGDPDSIPKMIAAAEAGPSDARLTALWAISETGDQRFLPWLADAMGKLDAKLRPRIFQAIRRIRQKRDQAAAAGSLTVIPEFARVEGGRRTIRFSVLDASRREAVLGDRLLATHAAVYENNALILDYTLSAAVARERLPLTVAMPHVPAASELGLALAAAAETPLALKRPGDDWAAVRYRVKESAEEEKRQDPAPPAEAAPPPVEGMANDASPAPPSPEAPKVEAPPPPNPEEAFVESWRDPGPLAAAALTLDDLLAHIPAGRDLLLIAADPPPLASAEATLAAVKSSGAVVHTALLETSSPESLAELETLARETGGVAARYLNLQELHRAIETILVRAMGVYRIVYNRDGEPPAGASVKLQLCSPRGVGEIVLPFESPAPATSSGEASTLEA